MTCIARVSALALALAFAALGGTACARREAHRDAPSQRAPVNVLLITVDTLRPDALGWVSGRNATPEIDRLARESYRFPAAVAPVPLTFPSHAALFTGVLPRRLGLRDNGQLLGATPATLAETLKQRGYATAAFVSGYPLASEFGLDRGFDVYDDRFATVDDAREADPERSAAATTDAALAWLRTARAPWFAWIHYYDPHYPYEPPPELARGGERGAYWGEVAAVDAAIGRLRAALDARTPALTVFTADHGESLGEHGEGTHGFFVYDSTMLVPLVFHMPSRIKAGESVAPARLIDVAPTVLALLGFTPLRDADGVSLLSLLEGNAQTIPPAYLETYQPWTSYGWSPLHAVRDGRWKFIAAPVPELYDLGADPGEARNLFHSDHRKVRELERVRRSVVARPATTAAGSPDPEALAKLRSLGYVGAGAASSEPNPGGALRDPKHGTALREILTEADTALRDGDPAGAIPRFDAVLREDPDNRFALLRSATALLALDRADEAAARLERAVRLDPRRAEARALLADALLKTGRPAQAVDQAMELVRLQPRSAASWVKLGTALGLARRFGESVDAFARAVALEPGEPRWLARLAFAQHAAGRRDDAIHSLRKLAEITGDRFAHAGALGILLAQAGRTSEARAWLEKSRPGEGDYAEARRALAALEAER